MITDEALKPKATRRNERCPCGSGRKYKRCCYVSKHAEVLNQIVQSNRNKYYEFEVSLIGVEPKIYRQFGLPTVSTFSELHNAIQCACDWTNDHIHIFRANGKRGRDNEIGGSDPMGGTLQGIKSDENVLLYSYFDDGSVLKKCIYEYDLGDGWEHEVKLLRVFEDERGCSRILIGGARAFPPEDCGGIPGYYRCCEVLESKGTSEDSKDDEEQREWIGDWNPEEFDFEEVKKNFE